MALRLQLSESWCRAYQVLPGRTHPVMSMPSNIGWILSGIKVAPHDPAESAAERVRAQALRVQEKAAAEALQAAGGKPKKHKRARRAR